VHDWTSHAADSFRYLALTLDRKAARSGFYRRIVYRSTAWCNCSKRGHETYAAHAVAFLGVPDARGGDLAPPDGSDGASVAL
jgi:hypothetical protein